MTGTRAVPLVLVALLAGCASPAPPSSPGTSALAWLDPVALPGQGQAYEPTIAIAPDGAAYVTAHKASLATEAGRLSSWLWWAPAAEGPWEDLAPPGDAASAAYALEGDVATDESGRMYFVDTYLDDVHLHRYLREGDGRPALESSGPILVSAGQDDRPWIVAQGDGVVHLLTNKADLLGSSLPAPGNGARGNIWLHVSTDRGESWTTGDAFEASRWCTPAMLAANDAPLHVGCVSYEGDLSAFVSGDHGASFERIDLGGLEGELGFNFPASAVDGLGRAYHAYLDRVGETTTIRLARIENGTATLDRHAPWNGTLLYVAIAASAGGRVAVAFQAEAPDEGGWRAYALVGRGAEPMSTWTLAEIDRIGSAPLGDMFDLAFTPDERLVATYARATDPNPGAVSAGVVHVRVEAPP